MGVTKQNGLPSHKPLTIYAT